MEPLQERELILLAKDISSDKFAELCDTLGLSFARGQSILATYHNDFIVAMQHILMEWKTIKQTNVTQSRSILASKLRKIGLGALGDKLSKGGYQPNQCDPHDKETASLQSSSAPSKWNKRVKRELPEHECELGMVHEKEFLKLAKRIKPFHYFEVGITLGIDHALLEDIRKRCHSDQDAMLDVLMKWRVKQAPDTDIRSSLADLLQEVELQELSGKLRRGTLLTS